MLKAYKSKTWNPVLLNSCSWVRFLIQPKFFTVIAILLSVLSQVFSLLSPLHEEMLATKRSPQQMLILWFKYAFLCIISLHWEWEKTHRNIKNLSSPNHCFLHRENILTIFNTVWVPIIFFFKACVILVLHSFFPTFAGTIWLTVSIFLHTSLQISKEIWASLFLSRIWPTKVIRKAVLASFPGGILKKIWRNGKVNIFPSWKNSTEGTCTIINLFPNFRALDSRFWECAVSVGERTFLHHSDIN